MNAGFFNENQGRKMPQQVTKKKDWNWAVMRVGLEIELIGEMNNGHSDCD
jgi:hypothetical protein